MNTVISERVIVNKYYILLLIVAMDDLALRA